LCELDRLLVCTTRSLDAGTKVCPVIRLLVVAETRLYREGLVRLLGSLRSFHIAGSAADLAQTLDALNIHAPVDVVLLDMGMPGAGDLIAYVRRGSPPTRVVAMAIHDLRVDLVAAAVAGATGYLTRDASKAELVQTLHQAARGEVTCSSAIAAALMRVLAEQASVKPPIDAAGLTSREREIVALIGAGFSNKEIARRLYIALPTVKNHVHNILDKLQVQRRVDVAARVGPSGAPDRHPLPRSRLVSRPL
jgi:two-component system, NarL family, nitrate/nitrite response regulator NarL